MRKVFLSLLAILLNSAFRWEYLSFYPLLFTSPLFSAICKSSSDSHFAFLHFFFLGMVLIHVSCTMSQTSVHSSASNLASITSHIHNWVFFFLCLFLFILSGVISPLISSNILDTCQPGAFIFQCPLFLPFHTVRGVLMARILKLFAIPFSRFVRSLHHGHDSYCYV